MFLRFQAMKERKESGFTLIELLVVILIIAILAAIAIPVFLNQRKKGWTAQQESSLKNAAIAAETWAIDQDGSYDGMTEDDLTANGYNETDAVTLAVVPGSTGESEFCLSATHEQDDQVVLYYDSDIGKPDAAACT